MKQVILSYGMGVDSTAILLRWITEPETCPCDLSDLIVMTAMVGDEYASTGRLIEDHILPRLREHGIRFAQVAKAGRYEADGIVVLDDSRTPEKLFLSGSYKLSDEMFDAATIPTTGGTRKCSVKFKGFVLDYFAESVLQGDPYLHVIGFATGEEKRVAKDMSFGTLPGREPSYPLIEWGWDRQDCIDYIHSVTGVTWLKSACVFCPFARPNGGVRERWKQEPELVADALEMEELALRFNPRMKLFASRSMRELVESTGYGEAFKVMREREKADDRQWAIYHMRRAFKPAKANPEKRGHTARSIRCVFTSDREGVLEELAERALHFGSMVDDYRVIIIARGEGYPAAEEFLVAAPFGITEKDGRGFDKAWDDVNEALAPF